MPSRVHSPALCLVALFAATAHCGVSMRAGDASAPDATIDPCASSNDPLCLDAASPSDASAMADTGPMVPPPPDVARPDGALPDGGDPGAGASEVLPAFDAETDTRVRVLVARGRARGNRHDVVAKIGDSITESASFLQDCGMGWYTLGAHAGLEPTIRYFSTRPMPEGRNPLSRQSLSATAGWTAAHALMGGATSPLAQELDATNPQWAVVMYGTNDLERFDLATYRANLARVLDTIVMRDVVPVVSTIPDRTDREPFVSRVATWNDAIRALARERHLPVVDDNAALRPLPQRGLSSDGIHPNIYDQSPTDARACVFTPEGLAHGYNMRNLTTLQILERLRAYQ